MEDAELHEALSAALELNAEYQQYEVRPCISTPFGHFHHIPCAAEWSFIPNDVDVARGSSTTCSFD